MVPLRIELGTGGLVAMPIAQHVADMGLIPPLSYQLFAVHLIKRCWGILVLLVTNSRENNQQPLAKYSTHQQSLLGKPKVSLYCISLQAMSLDVTQVSLFMEL